MKQLNKVDYQIEMWKNRGILEYLTNWMVDMRDRNVSPLNMWKALCEKEAVDVDISIPLIYDLVNKMTADVIKMDGDDIVAYVSGGIKRGLQKNDTQARALVMDMGRDKISKHLNLSEDTVKERGVYINIGVAPGSLTGNGEDISKKLSNIENLDTMEYLKDDEAYEQLKKDKEEEERFNRH